MISVLTPTRNRADALHRMIDSARDHAANVDGVEFVLYCDDDDSTVSDVLEMLSALPTTQLRYYCGPRITMSDMWNALLPKASGDLVMLGADDLVFRSRGWDVIVENAFEEVPDKILYVHGDDLSGAGAYYGTHGIVHRRWIETIGYFTGPGFSADYADYWLTQIAEFIGRRKFLPYITEHRHHVFGKAAVDQTYLETIERHRRDNPPQLYRDRLPERMRDAQKLIEAIECFGKS